MPKKIIRRKHRLSSFQTITLGFAGVILLGALQMCIRDRCKVHCQNGCGGLDSAEINPTSEKLSILPLTKGCGSIGKQDRQ